MDPTRSCSSTKRPAEPYPAPEVQPRPIIPNLKPKSIRMSSIPISITKANLSRILEGLGLIQTTDIENFLHTGLNRRGNNIQSLSLAPAPASVDTENFQVATVTFMKIPPELEDCISDTGTGSVMLGEEGEEGIEIDVDSHFHGLTPLSYAANPTVEYVVLFTLPTFSLTP